MAKRKVLVTGASGYIAGQLLPAFRERYELRLLDIKSETRDGKVIEDIIIADIEHTDLDDLRPHFRGIQTVVHLAYKHHSGNTIEHYYDEWVNVEMAYKVYRLSFEEGAERVVMASSNHAADWYEHPIREKQIEMIDPTIFPLSDNFYGWAKIAYETMGFIFACGALGRKMGVVQIRIGAPREIDVPRLKENPASCHRNLGAYISERDLQQLFCKSIEAPSIDNEWGIPFQIFYGISDNTRKFWSIANARKVIGYSPDDDSEVKYAKEIAEWLASIKK